LEKYFKSIVEPLKQSVENTANDESQPIKKEVNVVKDRNIKKRKPENNEDVHDENDNDSDSFYNRWMNVQKNRTLHQIMCRLNRTHKRSHVSSVEDVYETSNELLETLVNLCKCDKFVRKCIINWALE